MSWKVRRAGVLALLALAGCGGGSAGLAATSAAPVSVPSTTAAVTTTRPSTTARATTTTTMATTTTSTSTTTTTTSTTSTTVAPITTVPTIGSGTYIVPDEIVPGVYRVLGYYARLDANQEIIKNDLTSSGPTLMQVL